MSKYSNHEKLLEDYENDEREGFKVEVNKRPDARGRHAATSSGRKGDKNFSNKFGQNNDDQDMDDIEEDIQTERNDGNENKIESSLGHQAGITVS